MALDVPGAGHAGGFPGEDGMRIPDHPLRRDAVLKRQEFVERV